jgi:transcriptional regulator with XRE-family HTH domain
MMTLGERLRQLRERWEDTLKVIADETGLSVSYLSDIERGRTEPSLKTLAKLARAYHINVPALLAPVDLDGLPDEPIQPLPFDEMDGAE